MYVDCPFHVELFIMFGVYEYVPGIVALVDTEIEFLSKDVYTIS